MKKNPQIKKIFFVITILVLVFIGIESAFSTYSETIPHENIFFEDQQAVFFPKIKLNFSASILSTLFDEINNIKQILYVAVNPLRAYENENLNYFARKTIEKPLIQTNEILVTSNADSGSGTFRNALENAWPGTVIHFDPSVFPPENPAKIQIKSVLPDLSLGRVTIDASNAGVILDGSLLGNESEQVILDDISLSLDGGENILLNGDFNPEQQLNYWSFWQQFDVDNFYWNGDAGGTESGAFEWNGTSRQYNFSLIYQNQAEPVNQSGDGNGWHETNQDAFLPLNGAKTLNLNFRYQYGNISPSIKFFSADYQEQGFTFEVPYQKNWNQVNYEFDVPEGAVWVVFELNIYPTQSYRGIFINSNENIIQGLQIENFPGTGVVIENGFRNQIGGAQLGLENGCSGKCNLISGNSESAVFIVGGGENIIQGNYFGVDRTGTAVKPNGFASMRIFDSTNNQIGGHISLGEGNLLSGSSMGVEINQDRNEILAEGNIIQGNLIGTDAVGIKALGNQVGISLAGSSYTLIGGSDPDLRNIISGNEAGVFLSRRAHHNTFLGNYIGVDLTGLKPMGNLNDGINLADGANFNQIGSEILEEGNIISGNQGNGVVLSGPETKNNLVAGNLIGLGADGAVKIPNQFDGIGVYYAFRNQIGPGNQVMYNGNLGININIEGGINTNLITKNSITQNQSAGVLVFEGNQPIYPRITELVISSRSVDGVTTANTTIEIYQDVEDEGVTFLASVSADEEGGFHWVTPAGEVLNNNITLLVTDSSGGTSSFSKPAPAPDPFFEEIPGIVSPEQISLTPQVIAINTVTAVLALLFFGMVATWFNESLESFSKEITETVRSFLTKIRLMRKREVQAQPKKNKLWIILIKWLVILSLTAFIQTFLDPEIRFNLTWLGQLATLVLSGLFITGLQITSEWVLRRLSPAQPDVKETEISLVGMVIAAVSVLFSRIIRFSPGVVLGTVDGLYLNPELEDIRQNGQRALAAKGIVFGITFLGWLFSPLASHLPGLQALLITMFVIGIQYAFFELIPLKVLDGYAIRCWNQWIWRMAFLISTIGFIYLCINPDIGDLSAIQENNMLTLLVMAVVLLVAALLLKIFVKNFEPTFKPEAAVILPKTDADLETEKTKIGD